MESFPTLLLHTARIWGFTANILGSIKGLWNPKPQDIHLEFKGLQHTQKTLHWNKGNCSYWSCSCRDQVFHAHGCTIGSTGRITLRMGTKRRAITRKKMQCTWSCTTEYGKSCNSALHVGRYADDLPLPSTATRKSQLLSTKYNHWSSKLFFNCSFNPYLSLGRVCCTPALFSLKQSMSFISALVSEDKEQMASYFRGSKRTFCAFRSPQKNTDMREKYEVPIMPGWLQNPSTCTSNKPLSPAFCLWMS